VPVTMASPIPNIETQSRPGRSHNTSPHHESEFKAFIDNHNRSEARQGLDGREREAPFIMASKLVDYWNTHGIKGELSSLTNIRRREQFEGYVIIFSILVYIGWPEFIKDFMRKKWKDDRLPFRKEDLSSSMSTSPTLEMVELFLENQWKFCPVSFFGHDLFIASELHPRQILPIAKREMLTESPCSDTTRVYRVTLHEDCTDFSPDVRFSVAPFAISYAFSRLTLC
jgi:hypothetical protein